MGDEEELMMLDCCERAIYAEDYGSYRVLCTECLIHAILNKVDLLDFFQLPAVRLTPALKKEEITLPKVNEIEIEKKEGEEIKIIF